MAVDPLIARGVQPLDMTNALIGVAGLRQRDRALAQDQQVIDFRQNALMQAQQQQEDDDAEWEQAYAAKDWGRMARLDPQTTKILWDREQASKPPAPLEVQNLPGYGTVVTQGGEFKASRANPAPQQRPTGSWSAPFDAVGADGKPGKYTQHSITGEVRPVNVGGRQIAPVSKPGEEQVQPNPNLKGVTGFEAMPNNVKLTEVQGKNYLGASMMAEHLPVLTDLLKNGYSPTRTDLYAVGPPLKGVGNSFMQEITSRESANPNANQFFTAGSKILTAILRPESGGAITEDEWTMYGPIYLPWPGDSKEDIARKMTSLNEYMKRLAQVSGPASGYFSGGKEEEVIDLPTPR